jgi:hypothetical protein
MRWREAVGGNGQRIGRQPLRASLRRVPDPVAIQTWGKRFSEAIGNTPDVDDAWAQRVQQALRDWVQENPGEKYPYTLEEGIDLAKGYRARKTELAAKTSDAMNKALTEGLAEEDAEQLGKDLQERLKLESKEGD